MKCVLSVIWFVFIILFFMLGRAHWIQSKHSVPPFRVTTLVDESRGGIKVFGTPIDKPLEDFAADFNKYLDEQNQSNRRVNRLAACGYFLAALTAFVAMVVVIAASLRCSQ